jgi:hypothetical protein
MKDRKEKPPSYPGERQHLLLAPVTPAIAGITEGLQNAASGANAWQRKPAQFPYFYWERSQRILMEYGKTQLTASAPSPDRLVQLWRELEQGTEHDIDMFFYVLSAFYLSRDQAAWIWAKDFLNTRGIEPKKTREGYRAGHRGEDIDKVETSLYRLESIWVTIWASEPKGKKRYVLEGRLINILDRWSQESLDGEEKLPVAWLVQPGDGLQEYLRHFPSFAYLCKKVLSYDPYREVWEKRLARYFFFHLRFHGGGELRRSVKELLEANALPIDRRNPERTRARLEKCLNQLRQDGFIDNWLYPDQSSLPARGWLEEWKQRIILISAAPKTDLTQPLPSLALASPGPRRRSRRRK